MKAGLRMGAVSSVLLVAVVAVTSSGSRDGLVMLAGIPVLLAIGCVVGWLWGPRANVSGRWQTAAVVTGVALTATVGGATAVATTLWLVTLSHGNLDPAQSQLWGIQNLAAFWLVGLVVFGLPSLLLTLPMAVSWRRETAGRAAIRG